MKTINIFSNLILFLSIFLISCNKDIEGCMEVNALNYNVEANVDDNSCIYEPKVVFYSNENDNQLSIKYLIDFGLLGESTFFPINYSATCDNNDGTFSISVSEGSYYVKVRRVLTDLSGIQVTTVVFEETLNLKNNDCIIEEVQ